MYLQLAEAVFAVVVQIKLTEMNIQKIKALVLTSLALTGCKPSPVDKEKRDILVKKYDLMKFPNIQQPVLMTIDEFFDGNNDEASIAPNLAQKPEVSHYYDVLKELTRNSKVIEAFVEINEVMIYEGGKLDDNEWFYTDMIYFVGDITKEEVREATKTLRPDEVEYDNEGQISNRDIRFRNKNVVYIWWD